LPTSQSKQATVDAVEYLPTAQAAHVVAPVPASVFVIEPSVHTLQSLAAPEPVVPIYKPAAHSEQVATSEACENFPAVHSVQALAPGSMPVLVTEPAVQAVHAAIFDVLEYLRTAHAVQSVAAGAEPVSVMDPGWQSAQ
jgi:hypothetical protein